MPPSAVKAAIRKTDEPKCERFTGYYLVETPTGELAVPLRCHSHKCPYCARFLRLAGSICLQRALDQAKGRARLMTFTDGHGEMTSTDINHAWRKLAARLKYRGLLGEIFRALEVTQAGRLHLHAVNIETEERGGGFIAQAELAKLAEACGFGKICDIREVATKGGEPRSIAAYLTKGDDGKNAISKEATRLSAYLSKSTAERRPEVAHKLNAERLRPVNLSRGFSGGALRETEREICRHFADNAGAEVPEAWELWRESEAALVRVEARAKRREADATEEAAGGASANDGGDEGDGGDEFAPTEAKTRRDSLSLVHSQGNDTRQRRKPKDPDQSSTSSQPRAAPAEAA